MKQDRNYSSTNNPVMNYNIHFYIPNQRKRMHLSFLKNINNNNKIKSSFLTRFIYL